MDIEIIESNNRRIIGERDNDAGNKIFRKGRGEVGWVADDYKEYYWKIECI